MSMLFIVCYVHRVHLAMLVPLELLVTQVLLELLEHRVLLAQPDPLAILDHLV